MLDTGRIPLTGEALTWYRQGLASATSGELEKAVALYNQVIHVRPDFWEAWYERGLVLEELGLYAEAIASYDRAVVLEPSPEALVEIWFHRANALHYGVGDTGAAMQGYEYVLQLKPSHAPTWHHRGNLLLYEMAQPGAALMSYEHSLQHRIDDAQVWRNRGNALVELERYLEALNSYDRALAINPQDEIAQQGRKLAAQRGGLRDSGEITTQTCWYGQGETLLEPEVSGFDLAGLDLGGLRLPAFEIPTTSVQPMITIEDSSGIRELSLYQKQYTIGRDPRNDICLKSQFASRFHAVLRRVELSDGSYGYRIQDGDATGKPSTNGIHVNGRRSEQQDLRSGDVIIFGPQTTITFWVP
jgi:tetratricopeptide (TPR) repeat protein